MSDPVQPAPAPVPIAAATTDQQDDLSKPWYLSNGFWGGVVALVTIGIGIWHQPGHQPTTDQWTSFLAAGYALKGRIEARGPITLRKKPAA
jgi:hypothetical protein